MGNDCSALQGNADPCQIAACVKSLTGLESNSASPTDLLIVTMNDCTTYKGVHIPKAFLKIWITSPVSHSTGPEVGGLNYELKVYAQVIKPLIDSGVCPFFVKLIVGVQDCSFAQVLKLYKKAFEPSTPDNVVYRQVSRNFSFMYGNQEGRPAIQDRTAHTVVRRALPKNTDLAVFRLAFLITEQVQEAVTLSDFMYDAEYADENEVFVVLMQVAYACQALVLSQTAHNDLHLGNIMLRRLPVPLATRMTYVHDNGALQSVDFELTVKVHVFDFDRAYSPRFEANPLVVGQDVYNMTNELIDNRDLLKVLGTIVDSYTPVGNRQKPHLLTPDATRKLLRVIASAPSMHDAIRALWKTNTHFMTLPNGRPASRQVFAEFNTTREMLLRLMRLVKPLVLTHRTPDLVVTLKETDFEPTGKLKRTAGP